MRFGLFGGARTDPGEQADDSRIYTDYIDYICEAEALGFHSVFLVEHHFTGFGRVSHHGKYWNYEDVVIEPAPVQKPHPPLWVGAASPNSIRYGAENGYNLLLGQGGGPETVAEGIAIYRRAVEAQGRAYDSSMV